MFWATETMFTGLVWPAEDHAPELYWTAEDHAFALCRATEDHAPEMLWAAENVPELCQAAEYQLLCKTVSYCFGAESTKLLMRSLR